LSGIGDLAIGRACNSIWWSGAGRRIQDRRLAPHNSTITFLWISWSARRSPAAELFSHTTECFRCKLERTPPRLERGWMSVSASLPPAPLPRCGQGRGTGGKGASLGAPCVAGPVGATRRRLAPAKEAAPAFLGQSSALSCQSYRVRRGAFRPARRPQTGIKDGKRAPPRHQISGYQGLALIVWRRATPPCGKSRTVAGVVRA
jgi:hypothetical protein